MAVYSKITFGLALAGLLVGQAAFAEAPRASDPRLGSAQAGNVVGFRQSAKVVHKNGDVAGIPPLAIMALVPITLGTLAAAGAFDGNNDNGPPASP